MIFSSVDSAIDAGVSQEVVRLSGMRVPAAAWPRLEAFLRERTAQLQLDTPQDYAGLLARGGPAAAAEFARMGAQFSTPETYFFRDHGQIQLLRETLLPPLLARRDRPVRIWSCGCSTGEEIYTLAMLAEQMLGPAARERVVLVGTDLSEASLDKARAGRYGEWSFRGCDASLRQRYFREGPAGTWTLEPALREQVRFQACDLIHDELPSASRDLQQFDLILCRNVFIYFTPDTVLECLRKLARCLDPQGMLLTGHNEVLSHENAGLRLELHPQSAVLRRRTHEPAPAGVAPPPAPPPPPSPPAAPARPPVAQAVARLPRAATPTARLAPPAPDIEAELAHAWRLADLGDRAAARQACLALLQRDPTQVRAHYLRAVLAIESNDLDQALAALKRALYLDPGNIAVHVQLAEIQHRVGEPAAARRSLESAARLLARLPPQAPVPWLEGNRAGQVLAYVQGLAAQEDKE